MDLDGRNSSSRPPSPSQQQSKYVLQPTNALAGPSTLPEQPTLPSIYLPPPLERTKQRVHFDSTQDLLGRFQLLSAYDKYVRPLSMPVGVAGTVQDVAMAGSDKGKGKEKELPPRDVASPVAAQSPGGGNDGDDEDAQAKGDKKWKTNYKYLIKGIPGKHSMKKDDYLTTMMQVPPKQRIPISPFDLKTQRDAFSVSLDGLKGWNINALVAESPQAREDRKRRKELKKLAKAGGVPPVVSTPSLLPTTPGTTGVPTPGAVTGTQTAPARSGTPRPGTQAAIVRPSAPPTQQPQQNASQPRGLTPAGVGTPRSIPTPSISSTAVPAAAQARSTPIPTPAATPGGGAAVDPKRGVKREREDSVGQINGGIQPPAVAPGVTVSTNTNGSVKPAMVTHAKAGGGGVRPRPLKKQRMDVQGQARDMPVQQPTPHA